MHSFSQKTAKSAWRTAVLVSLVCTIGCGTNIRRVPGGGFRPKKANFCLKEKNQDLGMDDLVDVEAIYVRRRPNDSPFFEGETLYTFYRFFSNGKAYNHSEVLDHFPTNRDINNLKVGDIGYYKVAGKKIMTEFFVPIDIGKFVVRIGTIEEDKIIFTETSHGCKWDSRTTRMDDEIIAHKVKESWMNFTAEPDW